MNYKELRIGDYITSKTWGGYHKIQGIEASKNGYFEVKVNNYIHKIREDIYSEIEPIPLTEDVLLLCGFNKDYKKGYIGIDCYDSDFVLTYPNVLGEWQTFFVFEYTAGNLPMFQKLEYLHQLQNLFQSLVGQELEIQDNKKD